MVMVGKHLIWWRMRRCGRSVGQLLRELMRSLIFRMIVFCGLGSKWIKSFGNYKLSPDAFIQMAIQLAWCENPRRIHSYIRSSSNSNVQAWWNRTSSCIQP